MMQNYFWLLAYQSLFFNRDKFHFFFVSNERFSFRLLMAKKEDKKEDDKKEGDDNIDEVEEELSDAEDEPEVDYADKYGEKVSHHI